MGVEIAYMQDKSDQIRDMLGYLQNNIVFASVARILEIMNDRSGFADVEDDRPLPGSEWRLELYRERAALQCRCGRSGQRRTDGYPGDEGLGVRPEDNDEEVDIRVRCLYAERNLSSETQVLLLGDDDWKRK